MEYVDHGVSGSKDRRPALDRLVKDATAPKFDVLVTLEARSPGTQPEAPDHAARGPAGARRGVRLASARASTPRRRPGSCRCTSSGAIAEFERGRIVERVRAGLARAKAQGKRLGRRPCAITDAQFVAVADGSLRDAAGRSASAAREKARTPSTSAPANVHPLNHDGGVERAR